MIHNNNAVYGVLFGGFLCLISSTSGYAADAAPKNQNQAQTQPQPQTQTQTQPQPKKTKKGSLGTVFFALSRGTWKAIEKSDKWPEQATYMTTLPFYFVTDFVMSATVSTVLTSAPFLAATQKRPAAWNNPKSMIAKATEPQGSQ